MDFITLAVAKQQAKKYIDTIVESLSSGFSYKGSVSSFDNLPISPSAGDEYTIKDTKSIAVWDGDDWFLIDGGVKIINSTISSGQLTKNISIDVRNKVISILLIEHNSRQLVYADVKVESDKVTITLREVHNEDIDISVSII